MPIRAQISKETAQGEQVLVHIEQCNPITGEVDYATIDDMAAALDKMLVFTDVRMHEMNLRMLEAYRLESYFDPGEWMKVAAILDILAGRQSAAQVKHRWDSIREENAALEEGRRLAGLHNIVNGAGESVDLMTAEEINNRELYG